MKITGYIAIGFLGLLVLGAVGTAFNLITIPWLKFNRQIETNREIINKTYNADNALYNYHWFQERSQAIVALQGKIKNADEALASFELLAGARDKWTFEDKTEDSRLRIVALGLKSQYEDLVHEYNARASEVDRAIFKDSLPLFFNLNPY